MRKKPKHAGGRPPLPEEERLVQVTVSISPDVLDYYREVARLRGISFSAFVECALGCQPYGLPNKARPVGRIP